MKIRIFYLFSLASILVLLVNCSKDDPIIEYILATSISPPNGGTVTPSSGTFESGEIITLKATPNEHYKFKTWSGVIATTESTVSLKMDSDKTITVYFELKDTDGDGVTDDVDKCPDTPNGETPDRNGCSPSQVEISFNNDVQPIFTNNCVQCHTTVNPNLTAGNAYGNLVPEFVTAGDSDGSKLYTQVLSGHGGASNNDIAFIKAWINQGAKNN